MLQWLWKSEDSLCCWLSPSILFEASSALFSPLLRMPAVAGPYTSVPHVTAGAQRGQAHSAMAHLLWVLGIRAQVLTLMSEHRAHRASSWAVHRWPRLFSSVRSRPSFLYCLSSTCLGNTFCVYLVPPAETRCSDAAFLCQENPTPQAQDQIHCLTPAHSPGASPYSSYHSSAIPSFHAYLHNIPFQ